MIDSRVQASVVMDRTLQKEFKIYAFKQDKTMSEIVVDIITDILNDDKKAEQV